MDALKMIHEVVAKGNIETKPKLIAKNTYYLESFKRNNREQEYQDYTTTAK